MHVCCVDSIENVESYCCLICEGVVTDNARLYMHVAVQYNVSEIGLLCEESNGTSYEAEKEPD